MKTIFRILVIVTSFAAVSCGPRKDDSKKEAEKENKDRFESSDARQDAEWAVKVADGGMLEVKASELAQTNASSAEVKSFAAMMIKDHGAANSELKDLAAKKGIALPDYLSNDCQGKFDDLAKKTGKDFDEAYTDLMVKDHEKTLDAFKKEADKGNDADIKSWAAGKISTLEHHLDMAKRTEEIADKEKK